MKVRPALLVASLLLASPALADELPPVKGTKPVEFKNTEEKASYGFGYQIGRTLRGQGLQFAFDMLTRGLRDGLESKKPAAPEQELFSAMQEHERASRTALATANKKKGEAFLESNKKKEGVVTLDSGLQYTVLKEGDGPKPKATDRVKTHYHGTLIDGTVFDSSIEQGQPVSFGVNEVIPGWSEALQRMTVGSKWRIVVPSELAYGIQGAGPDIGPNSVLVFEVELLEIEQ